MEVPYSKLTPQEQTEEFNLRMDLNKLSARVEEANEAAPGSEERTSAEEKLKKERQNFMDAYANLSELTQIGDAGEIEMAPELKEIKTKLDRWARLRNREAGLTQNELEPEGYEQVVAALDNIHTRQRRIQDAQNRLDVIRRNPDPSPEEIKKLENQIKSNTALLKNNGQRFEKLTGIQMLEEDPLEVTEKGQIWLEENWNDIAHAHERIDAKRTEEEKKRDKLKAKFAEKSKKGAAYMSTSETRQEISAAKADLEEIEALLAKPGKKNLKYLNGEKLRAEKRLAEAEAKLNGITNKVEPTIPTMDNSNEKQPEAAEVVVAATALTQLEKRLRELEKQKEEFIKNGKKKSAPKVLLDDIEKVKRQIEAEKAKAAPENAPAVTTIAPEPPEAPKPTEPIYDTEAEKERKKYHEIGVTIQRLQKGKRHLDDLNKRLTFLRDENRPQGEIDAILGQIEEQKILLGQDEGFLLDNLGPDGVTEIFADDSGEFAEEFKNWVWEHNTRLQAAENYKPLEKPKSVNRIFYDVARYTMFIKDQVRANAMIEQDLREAQTTKQRLQEKRQKTPEDIRELLKTENRLKELLGDPKDKEDLGEIMAGKILLEETREKLKKLVPTIQVFNPDNQSFSNNFYSYIELNQDRIDKAMDMLQEGETPPDWYKEREKQFTDPAVRRTLNSYRDMILARVIKKGVTKVELSDVKEYINEMRILMEESVDPTIRSDALIYILEGLISANLLEQALGEQTT